MIAKGRQPTGHRHWVKKHPERRARGDSHGTRTHPESIARGSRNGHAKLRERDIATNFYLAEAGYRQQWIADAFSVSQSLVSRILNGNRWKPVYPSAKVKPARSGARPVEIPPWLWFSPRLTRRQGDRGPEGLRSP